MSRPDTIKTKVHTYRFDTSIAGEADMYRGMCAQLASAGLDCFAVYPTLPYGKEFKSDDEQAIELETSHMFNNQWNTACGKRVFDWYEPIYPNRHIKGGYWLEQTVEMRTLRQEKLNCGYCAKQYWVEELSGSHMSLFCNKCLDSPYLKPTDLCLLRLQPVGIKQSRARLTEQEHELIMPLYVERQTTAQRIRAVEAAKKARQEVVLRYNNAKREHDGMLWLLDRGMGIDNVIYYDHTGVFSFGWRSGVNPEVEFRLLDVLSEFPFPYEVKTADGRKLKSGQK